MSQGGQAGKSAAGSLTIPVTVPNGGTGQTTLPAHTVLLGEGTSAIGNVGPGAANTILMGSGAGSDPVFGSLVAGSNITLVNAAGTITISSSGGGGAGSITFTNDSASSATTNAGAINLFGDLASGSSVVGNGAQTMTVSNLSATTSQKGVVQLATNAQAIAGSDTAAALTSDDLKAKLGAQTLNGIAFGNGQSSALGWTAGGAANTVLLGNGGVPTFGTVPNAALTNSSVTLSSGNNITVTGGGPLSLGGTASFNVTGTTNHAVLVGNATGSIGSLATGTNGQVLVGSTGADPQFASLTSGDGSITFTTGAGTLALSVTGGTTTGKTITGDTGGALSPTAGNWNILGTSAQGLSTSGLGSTLTLTNADWTTAQKGVGVLSTNAQSIAGSGTTQAVTPASLGAKLGTQTSNGIPFGAGTSSALSWTAAANNGVLITGTTGTPSFLAAGTTGQVLLATTGSPPSWGTAPASAGTITGDSGGALSQTASNWNLLGQQAGTIPVMDTIGSVSTMKFENRSWTTPFIVDPSSTAGLRGTYTTISSALTDAASGQTIFVRTGTYTEDITLKAGVNITAYDCDAHTPNVTIVGKCTASFTGSCTISGIRLQTNSDFLLVVSGSNATSVRLIGCYLNISNNTGISFTSSNASSGISIFTCRGNIGTTGIALYTSTSSGTLIIQYTNITNGGASTTASDVSAGTVAIRFCRLECVFSTSSSGVIQGDYSTFGNGTNTTEFTHSATSSNNIFIFCNFFAGSGSCISIGVGASLTLSDCSFQSTNTNTITGSGTVFYCGLFKQDTGDFTINTTTQTVYSQGPRIQTGAGAQVMSGTGSPSGSVTAPKGTLYLRLDGSSSSTRAYINTNSGTSWTAITTAS